MREIWKLAWKLLLIAAVAGLSLGFTNALTEGPIAEQQKIEANAARLRVLPTAVDFELVSEKESGIDDAYAGKANGETVGYTAKITTKGYGGPIEVTVGMNLEGTITGISVGGANFAETAGLGAKTKDAAFTDQFRDHDAPVTLNQDVQAVTGATISSKAVTDAVNSACEYLSALMG